MEYEKKEFFFEGSLRDLVRAERQGYAAGRLILHQQPLRLAVLWSRRYVRMLFIREPFIRELTAYER